MATAVVLGRGWTIDLVMAETMPGPPPIVWDLITDWEHQDDWMLEASDFVVLSHRREGIGVEAAATIAIGGFTMRDRVRVVGWEPHRFLAIEHLGWVSGLGEIHLTPLGSDRTHLFWQERLDPPMGIVGAFVMTALKPVMERVFRRDLRVLKGLVRARYVRD